MNIDQLKMILDAVKDVSGGAQIVGILWALRTYFITVVIAVVVLYVGHKAFAAINHSIESSLVWRREHNFVKRVTGREYPDEEDLDRVEQWIEFGKKATQENKS